MLNEFTTNIYERLPIGKRVEPSTEIIQQTFNDFKSFDWEKLLILKQSSEERSNVERQ